MLKHAPEVKAKLGDDLEDSPAVLGASVLLPQGSKVPEYSVCTLKSIHVCLRTTPLRTFLLAESYLIALPELT